MIQQIDIPTDILFNPIEWLVYCCIVEQYDWLTYNRVYKIVDQPLMHKYNLYRLEGQYDKLILITLFVHMISPVNTDPLPNTINNVVRTQMSK